MQRLKIYRRILTVIFASSLIFLFIFSIHSVKSSIPDEIRVLTNKAQDFNFNLFGSGKVYKEQAEEAGSFDLDLKSPFTLFAQDKGSYKMDCKLFGLIQVKSVAVEVVEEQYLLAAGSPIGIYLETDGILIIGTGAVTGLDGLNYEPAENLVKAGDYIREIDGRVVSEKNKLIEYLNGCKGKEIVLKVDRNEEEIEIKIKPVQTGSEEYKLGIWVRDNTQGIGTLTYVDMHNNFGALGHGITDTDTGSLLSVDNGSLYNAQIMSIVKGESGSPGGLEGVINYDDQYLLGSINHNTEAGIFGKIDSLSDLEILSTPLEICLKQDIEIGDAKILSAVDGTIREYDIQITDVNIAEDNVNKGIVIKVTDSDLLALTGGIVQGMSGSPIVQNNKIIGAVTHVFVQDSTKGYGIFIENMLETEN